MSLVGPAHQLISISPRKSPERKKGSLIFLPSSSSQPTPTSSTSSPSTTSSLSSGSVPSLQLASPNINGSSPISPIADDRRRSIRFSQEFAYSVDLYKKIKEQQEKEESGEDNLKEDENSTEEDEGAAPKEKNYREILELKEKQIQNLTSVFLEQSKILKSRHEKDVEILKENFSKEAIKQKEEIEKLKDSLKAMEEEILNATNSEKLPNGNCKKETLNAASNSLSTAPLTENGHPQKTYRILQEEALSNLKSEILLEVKEEVKSEIKQEMRQLRSQMREELKEVSGELTEVREELKSMKREELKELKELKALLIGREETNRQNITGDELDVPGQEEGALPEGATAEEPKPLRGSRGKTSNVKEGFELGLGLGMGVALSLGLSLTLSIAGTVLLKLTTQSNGG